MVKKQLKDKVAISIVVLIVLYSVIYYYITTTFDAVWMINVSIIILLITNLYYLFKFNKWIK